MFCAEASVQQKADSLCGGNSQEYLGNALIYLFEVRERFSPESCVLRYALSFEQRFKPLL